jgi:hypothetical protein
MLDPRIRPLLKAKSVIDIGAFNGDSALVLSGYGKDIYSLELPAANFAVLNRFLAQHPSLSFNVRVCHDGVSDRDDESTVVGSGEHRYCQVAEIK